LRFHFCNHGIRNRYLLALPAPASSLDAYNAEQNRRRFLRFTRYNKNQKGIKGIVF